MLGAAIVAMAAVAGGPVPVDRPLDWALAGVGAGGRSLVVQPGVYGGCDQGTPEAFGRETRTEVELVVTVKTVQGPDVVCPAIAKYAPPITVHLRAPIAGRAVTGDLQADRPGFVLDSRTPMGARLRVPRVIGLASPDARQVLCSWRIATAPSRPPHPGGRVIAQAPRPGAAYRVPRGAAPRTCGGLPERPSVRLTIR